MENIVFKSNGLIATTIAGCDLDLKRTIGLIYIKDKGNKFSLVASKDDLALFIYGEGFLCGGVFTIEEILNGELREVLKKIPDAKNKNIYLAPLVGFSKRKITLEDAKTLIYHGRQEAVKGGEGKFYLDLAMLAVIDLRDASIPFNQISISPYDPIDEEGIVNEKGLIVTTGELI